MAYYNAIPNQITSLINRHDFGYAANVHHSGQKFRAYNRWSQFMAMLIGQLSGRKSHPFHHNKDLIYLKIIKPSLGLILYELS